ncbi:MAG TPA: integrase core domain-containing protein [Candidatus Sulfotelmatobacter sp.]|nr:integrase core domain-containing protein [Candidatus Sulfotelmatobacter sp.]
MAEIKTVPYVPLSHPFVEQMIGTIRREYLDRILFWGTADLQAKLLEFQHYYRTHASLNGLLPEPGLDGSESPIRIGFYRWQKHCRRLYQTAIAA